MNGTRSYVEFLLNGREFAVPLEDVREIIALPDITPLPMASANVRGMINLRGDVLPVVDLDSRLGSYTEKKGERNEVLILNMEGYSLGVVVEQAQQVVEFDEEDIDVEEGTGGIVRGVVHHHEKLVVVLDSERILNIDRETLETIRKNRKKEASEHEEQHDTSRQIVTFDLEGEVYAFPLEDVQEILRYQDPVPVPDSPSTVKGVLHVRGSILPVLSLRRRLQLEDTSFRPEAGKILVGDYGTFRIGFIADGIREVLTVTENEISPPPGVTRTESGHASVIGIVHTRGQVIALLGKDGLVDREAMASMTGDMQKDALLRQKGEERETFVVFLVAGQAMGLPITTIREINRIDEIARLPGVPSYVEGVMNLRGEIVPALSMKKRLGMSSSGEIQEKDQRVLVIETGDTLAGFIVDEVSGVAEVPRSKIGAPPLLRDARMEFGEAAEVVRWVARIQEEDRERILLIVDEEKILSPREARALREAAGA
jgi:purine-binding chemotaxis protein CheW